MEYLSFVKLNEMEEELKKSISNIKKVIEQQNLLLDVIDHSGHKKEFKQFVEGVGKANENYGNQLHTLEDKLSKVEGLLSKLSKNESLKQLTDELFSVLGII